MSYKTTLRAADRAGQGGQHPTQALLDLYTIYREESPSLANPLAGAPSAPSPTSWQVVSLEYLDRHNVHDMLLD
jgi:hypothetical protein